MKKMSNAKHYKPKSKVSKQIKALENSINTSWKEYNQLHEDLSKYSNRKIDSDEEWEEAMKIINDIQNKFIFELFPALNYINTKQNFCNRAAEGYNLWVDTLKNAGLVQEVVEEKKIIIKA